MSGTVAQRDRDAKAIRLLAGERAFVGIDNHKKDFRVSVWGERQEREVAAWVQPPAPAVLMNRLAPYRAQVARIAYEAGPMGYGLLRALQADGWPAMMAAPSRTPKARSKRPKSDALDARLLASYCAKGTLWPVCAPTPQEEADRQVVRQRERAIRDRRRAKQRIKSFLLPHGLEEPAGLGGWSRRGVEGLGALALSAELRFTLDQLLETLAHAQRQVVAATRAVRGLSQSPRHRRSVQRYRTAPGIGLIGAMTFETQLLRPERFDSPREVAAYLGLAPLTEGSGDQRYDGPLMPTGNPRLRVALIEAAWRYVRLDPGAAARFGRLSHRRGSSKKAIVALARRLGVTLWRMRVTDQPYDPAKAAPGRATRRRQPGLSSATKEARPPKGPRLALA